MPQWMRVPRAENFSAPQEVADSPLNQRPIDQAVRRLGRARHDEDPDAMQVRRLPRIVHALHQEVGQVVRLALVNRRLGTDQLREAVGQCERLVRVPLDAFLELRLRHGAGVLALQRLQGQDRGNRLAHVVAEETHRLVALPLRLTDLGDGRMPPARTRRAAAAGGSASARSRPGERSRAAPSIQAVGRRQNGLESIALPVDRGEPEPAFRPQAEHLAHP